MRCKKKKKFYKAVEMRALNFPASNSKGKFGRRGWERARETEKKLEERESFQVRGEKGSGKPDQVGSPGRL